MPLDPSDLDAQPLSWTPPAHTLRAYDFSEESDVDYGIALGPEGEEDNEPRLAHTVEDTVVETSVGYRGRGGVDVGCLDSVGAEDNRSGDDWWRDVDGESEAEVVYTFNAGSRVLLPHNPNPNPTHTF